MHTVQSNGKNGHIWARITYVHTAWQAELGEKGHCWHVTYPSQYRAVVSGGAEGTLAPPELGDLLTLFQPEGADYAHPIIASTLGFQNLTTALH